MRRNIFPTSRSGAETNPGSAGVAIDNSLIAIPDSYPYWPTTVGVQLYVIADHKKTLPGFNTKYADWVKQKDIRNWAVDEVGDALLQPAEKKYFLTKMTTSLTYSEMTEDLFPRDADNNKKVNAGTNDGWRVFNNILLYLLTLSVFSVFVLFVGTFSPLGIAFIIATYVQYKAKSRAGRVAAWIAQLIALAVYSLVALFLMISFGLSGNYGYSELPAEMVSSINGYYSSDVSGLWLSTAVIIPILSFLAIMIIILVCQVRRRRRQMTINNSHS
ncbi:MAG: hypothetical protein V1838_05625 [Patescibacteria group bacterium]